MAAAEHADGDEQVDRDRQKPKRQRQPQHVLTGQKLDREIEVLGEPNAKAPEGDDQADVTAPKPREETAHRASPVTTYNNWRRRRTARPTKTR